VWINSTAVSCPRRCTTTGTTTCCTWGPGAWRWCWRPPSSPLCWLPAPCTHMSLGRDRGDADSARPAARLRCKHQHYCQWHYMLGAQLKSCHIRAMAEAGGGGTGGGLPRPWSFSVEDFSYPEALFRPERFARHAPPSPRTLGVTPPPPLIRSSSRSNCSACKPYMTFHICKAIFLSINPPICTHCHEEVILSAI
jgi:hypothetical protein